MLSYLGKMERALTELRQEYRKIQHGQSVGLLIYSVARKHGIPKGDLARNWRR